MDLLSWDSRLELGIALLDDHHRKLFELFNKLEQTMNQDEDATCILGVGAELFQFARIHFEAEEHLMIKIGYPHLGRHREAHHRILAEGEQLAAKYGRGQERFGPELVRYVRTALFDHIRVVDRQVADYMARVSPSTQDSGRSG